MNLLRRVFSLLRTWLGLGDAADEHHTPSHGWLLPTPEVAPAREKGSTPEPRIP